MDLFAQDTRLTSSLNEVRNDTGRVAFCGPYVLAAITGYSISKVEEVVRDLREVPAGRKPVVKGTYTEEVAEALGRFGYKMKLVSSFMHLARKERPTLLRSR